MKIKTQTQSAGALLVFILIVAAVTVVSVGGCIVHRTAKKLDKIQKERLKDLTNEVSELRDFEAGVLSDYIGETGDTNAFTMLTYSTLLVGQGQSVNLRLMTSTNLTEWTEIAGGPLDELLSVQEDALRNINRLEPSRFFKLEAK